MRNQWKYGLSEINIQRKYTKVNIKCWQKSSENKGRENKKIEIIVHLYQAKRRTSTAVNR